MSSDDERTIHWLIEQDADTVSKWLDEVWAGSRPAPPDFNWLGLASIASTFGSRDAARVDDESSLRWMHICVRVREYLADIDPKGRDHFLYLAMLRRASAIARHGAVTGHPMLDPATVIAWFLDGISRTPAEAIQLSTQARQDIQSLTMEQDESLLGFTLLKELVDLRVRIDVIKTLAERNDITLPSEVTEWIAARPALP